MLDVLLINGSPVPIRVPVRKPVEQKGWSRLYEMADVVVRQLEDGSWVVIKDRGPGAA